ncbi:hypothetical protein PIB30_115208, partial [Stylosanthes scabra]|nr:hypothetical protein [Stylosanthes scabra]
MGEKCPWLAHCSKNSTLGCFQVKTYRMEHNCARDLGSAAADQHWLSRKIEKRLVIHPHMNKTEAMAFLKEDFNVTAHEKM